MNRCPLLRSGAVVAALAFAGCGRVGFDSAEADATGEMAGMITAIESEPPRFETTSTTFVDVPGGTVTIPPSPGRTWLLAISATLESSSGLYNAPEARYVVDGIERGLGGTEATVPGRAGPWQHLYVIAGTSAPIEVIVQARDALAATTAIDHLHVAAVPLSPESDPLFASSDAVIGVTSPTIASVATFTLTPSTPGEYLLMLLVNATEAPSTSSIDFQWYDPLGVAWGRAFRNPRGAWQSSLLLRRATLAGPTTIGLHAATVGVMAQLQYARVIGLRIAELGDAFAYAHSDVDRTTAAATPMLVNSLEPELGTAARYLVLGTARIEDDCANAQLGDRGVHYAIDGLVQSTGHVAGNCAYETTYGIVDVVDAAPSVVSLSQSSGNAQSVVHEESTLVVLGVP